MDFAHGPEFYLTRKHVSEAGYVSIFSEEKETPTLLSPLQRFNLNHIMLLCQVIEVSCVKRPNRVGVSLPSHFFY
jgi:hypothetical protein